MEYALRLAPSSQLFAMRIKSFEKSVLTPETTAADAGQGFIILVEDVLDPGVVLSSFVELVPASTASLALKPAEHSTGIERGSALTKSSKVLKRSSSSKSIHFAIFHTVLMCEQL